jgi:hypothetical protein
MAAYFAIVLGVELIAIADLYEKGTSTLLLEWLSAV